MINRAIEKLADEVRAAYGQTVAPVNLSTIADGESISLVPIEKCDGFHGRIVDLVLIARVDRAIIRVSAAVTRSIVTGMHYPSSSLDTTNLSSVTRASAGHDRSMERRERVLHSDTTAVQGSRGLASTMPQ